MAFARRGKMTAGDWRKAATRGWAALDAVARRAISTELVYIQAFYDEVRERFPDMEQTDKAALDLFLERAHERLLQDEF